MATVTFLVFATLLGGAGMAQAQMGMPGGMAPGGMNPPPQTEQKEEGPAEAAPEEEGKRAAEPGPETSYTNQRRRRTQVIELDGYFRARAQLLHNFNLGSGYVNETQPESGYPFFPTPLECGTNTTAMGCGQKNLGDTNMRLRLEPTINISDQVRVITQIDVFDNLIWGSTPDSLISASQPDLRTNLAQAGILSNSAVAPESGQNTFTSAIRPKRAWGEVDSQLGSLRFGRMPWHFGRGMYFNKGDCPDCDGGTTVDRVMLLTQLYGHQLALSWDFGPSGYAWGMTDAGRADPNGPPLDLSQNDEVVQITGALTMLDDDRRFRERVANGELVLNYGVQLVYRGQNNEVFKLSQTAQQNQNDHGSISRTDLSGTGANDSSLTQHIGAWLLIPSVWFKLGWKALTLEFESTGLVGRMSNAGPLRLQEAGGADNHLDILQLGWVAAAELNLYKNSLFVGFETGGATGDQAEAACQTLVTGTPSGLSCDPSLLNPSPYLNYRWKFVPQPLGDSSLNNFTFSPEYHVDEIFFRRIMGTITNAMYVKPSIAYWLDVAESRQLGLSGSVIYSLAPVPVSTPGNSMSYGVEMDLSLGYRNISEKFYAGVVWGVFWPFGALNRPLEIYNNGGSGTATAAQVLRGFLGIRF